MPHYQPHRPLSLDLSVSTPARPVSTSPSPQHRHSQSPFRYLQYPSSAEQFNEKATHLDHILGDNKRLVSPERPGASSARLPSSCSRQPPYPYSPGSAHPYHTPSSLSGSSPFLRQSASLSLPNSSFSRSYTRPRALRVFNLLKPCIPLVLYAFTSIAFVVAIALYKTEVFAFLDELSLWLRSDEKTGYAILFCLIFLTTIPPIPMYSTLIILSGYTFGPWTGAIISYFAALSGALAVFIVSRSLLRDSISRWLTSYCTIKRVVRAIEKRPKLLFLIRLAPYPYNVMNCLLAASPTLTLHTYTVCTALSLFKVIIHTSLGASIHSFKDYHVVQPGAEAGEDASAGIAHMWTVGGIVLCVAILIYLSIVARRAVDEELDDEGPITAYDSEETIAFLGPQSANDLESANPVRGRQMTELPSRVPQLMPYQPSPSVEHELNGQWS